MIRSKYDKKCVRLKPRPTAAAAAGSGALSHRAGQRKSASPSTWHTAFPGGGRGRGPGLRASICATRAHMHLAALPGISWLTLSSSVPACHAHQTFLSPGRHASQMPSRWLCVSLQSKGGMDMVHVKSSSIHNGMKGLSHTTGSAQLEAVTGALRSEEHTAHTRHPPALVPVRVWAWPCCTSRGLSLGRDTLVNNLFSLLQKPTD